MKHPIRLFAMALALAGLSAGGATAQDRDIETDPILVPSGDNVLRGEILRAAGTRPGTALIVVGGSGASTREATRPAAPLFLSDDIAVAILDRRGHGGSTGRYERPSTGNSGWLIPAVGSDIADVAAHLRMLGYRNIGVVGTSMGGWIAASAAARSDAIDFFAGFVGGAVPVAVSDTYDALIEQEGLTISQAVARAREVDPGTGYDPAGDLQASTQRGFWLFGELDTSNPTALETAALDALIAAGKPFRYVILQGADHNLVNVESGEFDASWLPEFMAFVNAAD